jgi:hypothetical protein
MLSQSHAASREWISSSCREQIEVYESGSGGGTAAASPAPLLVTAARADAAAGRGAKGQSGGGEVVEMFGDEVGAACCGAYCFDERAGRRAARGIVLRVISNCLS